MQEKDRVDDEAEEWIYRREYCMCMGRPLEEEGL
jgi:hypothetical protein